MRILEDLIPVITEHPMTSVERRTVGSLALLYSFRMLGLFMILPVFALYAQDIEGYSPFMVGMALGIYGLTQAFFQIHSASYNNPPRGN